MRPGWLLLRDRARAACSQRATPVACVSSSKQPTLRR